MGDTHINATRNYPASSASMVVIPLIMSVQAPVMDSSKYSIFLAGRISEQEFEQDCADMDKAFRNDPGMVKAAGELQNFLEMNGSTGCNAKCCGFMCVSCMFMFMPFACWTIANRNVGNKHTAAWQRVLQSESKRLNTKYSQQMVRFELGQETRISGISAGQNGQVRSQSTTTYWAAISIAGQAMSSPIIVVQQQQLPAGYDKGQQFQAQYGGSRVTPM